MHGYFKVYTISCRIVYDISLSMRKIRVTLCLWHVPPASRGHCLLLVGPLLKIFIAPKITLLRDGSDSDKRAPIRFLGSPGKMRESGLRPDNVPLPFCMWAHKMPNRWQTTHCKMLLSNWACGLEDPHLFRC